MCWGGERAFSCGSLLSSERYGVSATALRHRKPVKTRTPAQEASVVEPAALPAFRNAPAPLPAAAASMAALVRCSVGATQKTPPPDRLVSTLHEGMPVRPLELAWRRQCAHWATG